MNQKTARLLRKAQLKTYGDLRYYRRSAKRAWISAQREARAYWRKMMQSVVSKP